MPWHFVGTQTSVSTSLAGLSIHSPKILLTSRPDLFHTVKQMAKGEHLGEFEQLVLAALLMLGENGYGMTIHEKVEELTAGVRSVSLGSVFGAL